MFLLYTLRTFYLKLKKDRNLEKLSKSMTFIAKNDVSNCSRENR